MRRWRDLNKYGRSIGRGLTNEELVAKVVADTGATKAFIRASLSEKKRNSSRE